MRAAGESTAVPRPVAEGEGPAPQGAPEAGAAAGPEAEPFPLPALLDCLSGVVRGARSSWSPRLLLPAWSAALVLWAAWEIALPRLTGAAAGAGAGILRALAAAVTVGVVWFAAALAVVISAFDFGRDARLSVAQGLRAVRARFGPLVWSLLFIPGAAAVLLGLLAGGAAALGALPLCGGVLSTVWIVFPGFLLALFFAGFVLLGVPALPLVLCAAALEAPYPFDAVARSISYVRARPGRYLAALLCGVLGAALETLVFACFATLVLAAILVAGRAADFAGNGIGALSGLWADLTRAAVSLDPGWPLWSASPETGGGTVPHAFLLGAAGRALTGFAAVAMISCLSRTYLYLRWTLDGESPASLIRPDEAFNWTEE